MQMQFKQNLFIYLFIVNTNTFPLNYKYRIFQSYKKTKQKQQ